MAAVRNILSIVTALVGKLNDSSDVTAIVGSRIYRRAPPKGVTFPVLVVHSINSDDPVRFDQGPAVFCRYDCALEGHAYAEDSLFLLEEALVAALDHSGMTATDWRQVHTFLGSGFTREDEVGTGGSAGKSTTLYRRVWTLTIEAMPDS